MSIGPQASGLRKASEDDPTDTSEAIRELAAWMDDAQLARITWAAEMESRWNPHTENPIGAVGTWQFLPSTCKALGTDASTVRNQGRADHARLLAKMWSRKAPPSRDVYVALFYPAARGTPDDHVIFEPGSKGWQQNPGLREKGDGPITTGRVRQLGTPPKSWPSGAELRAWAGATKSKGGGGDGGRIVVLGLLALAFWYANKRGRRGAFI